MQPLNRHELDELMYKQVDVLVILKAGGKEVLRWCQGKVVEVYNYCHKPQVKTMLDPALYMGASAEGEEREIKYYCQVCGIKMFLGFGELMLMSLWRILMVNVKMRKVTIVAILEPL